MLSFGAIKRCTRLIPAKLIPIFTKNELKLHGISVTHPFLVTFFFICYFVALFSKLLVTGIYCKNPPVSFYGSKCWAMLLFG